MTNRNYLSESVGVVIPTYNRPEETLRAVQSALSQDFKPTRIIVIDDGSSVENFEKLQKNLESLDVELHRIEPSRHPGRARNHGVSLLDTKWVAFLDSDDIWYKNKLSLQIKYALDVNAEAICSNSLITRNNSTSSPYFSKKSRKISKKSLLKQNLVVNSSVLIKRDLLEEVGRIASSYSVRGCEDYATWLRINYLSDWHYISEPLLEYFDNPQNSVRGSEEFKQYFSDVYAKLDYANWLINSRKSQLKILKILLRLLQFTFPKYLFPN